MLATSILDEFSVPTCTAVCGSGSAKMLELIHGTHMFVAIVDDEARTYRYHQLIKEVLQAGVGQPPNRVFERRRGPAALPWVIIG